MFQLLATFFNLIRYRRGNTTAQPLHCKQATRVAFMQPCVQLRSFTAAAAVLLIACCLFILTPLDTIRADGAATGDPALNFLQSTLWSFVQMVGGAIVTAGGLTLESSLSHLVFGMGELLRASVGIAINTVWVVVRDTFNLLFIFGLIFIGLKIIWNSEDSRARSSLSRLIVAALLINFSLFIAKFIVDFSNIAAIQVYSLIKTLPIGSDPGWWTSGGGIASYVMHLTSLQSIGNIAETAGGYGIMIMVFIFYVFTGLVFFAGAIMLVSRFIFLCLYLIFSPVMFLGHIMPNFESVTQRWWDGFLKNAFFAPAYLFCVYIALRILASAQGTLTTESLSEGLETIGAGANAVTAGASAGAGDFSTTGATILFLVLSLGFMIAAIMAGQSMSMGGSKFSMGMMQGAQRRMRRAVGGATAGAAARLGRNTVGAAAHSYANSNFAKSKTNTLLGRAAHKASTRVADSSFDARQVAGAGKALGIGTGKKGGFTSSVKADAATQKKYLESIHGDLDDAEKERAVTTAKAADIDYTGKVNKKTELEASRQNDTKALTESEKELRDLNQKLNSSFSLSSKEKDAVQKDIVSKQTEISELKTRVTAADTEINKADQAIAEAGKAIEARVEYANELAYIKAMNSTARWKKMIAVGVAGVGGAAAVGTAAILAAPVAVPVALGAAAVTAGAAGYGSKYHTERIQKSSRDEYGADGVKKKKSSGEQKRIKELAKAVTDTNESSEDTGSTDSQNEQKGSAS